MSTNTLSEVPFDSFRNYLLLIMGLTIVWIAADLIAKVPYAFIPWLYALLICHMMIIVGALFHQLLSQNARSILLIVCVVANASNYFYYPVSERYHEERLALYEVQMYLAESRLGKKSRDLSIQRIEARYGELPSYWERLTGQFYITK